MKPLPTLLKALGVSTACALVLTGCSVYEMPLPGGTDVGDEPIEVTAEFADVLDLVPQTTVKVNDVSVGKITEIDLVDETAVVTMQLPNDIDLPDNAVAEIRQTSLLGEKFVSLSPPASDPSSEPLGDGDVIELADTGRNPEVEEVLGALSLVLNGGGVAQLKTIASELNLALEGREDSAKSVFRQVRTLMGQLDDGKADIVAAIEGLNRMSETLNDQIGTIDSALEELPSALQTLDQQRADLVRMLRAVNRLGDVGVDVIRASKQATIDSVKHLGPVLHQLADAGDAYVDAFQVFLTYPFVDEVVGRDPQVARNLHMGDYTNLSITLDVAVEGGGEGGTGLPTDLPTDIIDPTAVVGDVLKCLQSGDLTSKACTKVLANLQKLTKLREECAKKKNRNKDLCKQLNLLPGLPTPSGTGGPLDPITSLLGGLGGGAPAQRVGVGWDAGQGRAGPTMGQLSTSYDEALVALLVPGMVTR
ncbi:MCE family protein [Nocardioides sp.]|uniref:MCE family protein n=1 Tax=Nocardioides sp. TaxID=35761 RepID=UPI002ED0E20E